MRVTTRAHWASIDDFISNKPPLTEEGFEYSGPIAEMKKGREQTTAATNQALGTASTYGQAQTNARTKGNQFADQLMAPKAGELSPYAQGQYQSDVRNIQDTYGGLTQAGLKGLSYQGMNNGPSGMEASLKNSAIRNEGAAETDAYNRALQSTLGQGLAGMGYYQGQQQIYDPTRAQQTAIQGGQARSQEGSTLGDVMSGIQGLSSAFGNVAGGVAKLGL